MAEMMAVLMKPITIQNLGFEPIYPGSETEPESMSWVSQFSNANMIKTDFFEAKSTAYAKSSALVDDL